MNKDQKDGLYKVKIRGSDDLFVVASNFGEAEEKALNKINNMLDSGRYTSEDVISIESMCSSKHLIT